MISKLRDKYRYSLILLRELVITDFKLRYQGSALGYLWSILKPLFLFAILYLVFGYIFNFRGDVEHFAVYLLVGVVLWNFFTEATTQGLQAIVNRGDLIRKINFPKYIIIVSGTTSALVNLFFNFIVVIFFIIVNGVDIGWSALLIVPIVLELYFFALGLTLFLSAFNVKFRDIGYLWEILLQAAFYATPILYSISLIVEKSHTLATVILLNPVAQVIQDARYVLVTNQSTTAWNLNDTMWYGISSIALVLLILWVSIIYFKKRSRYFAEYV